MKLSTVQAHFTGLFLLVCNPATITLAILLLKRPDLF